MSHTTAAESTSDDSASTDEENEGHSKPPNINNFVEICS
jgi:hypothetical protein